jgi:hypothetical protein
MGSTSAPVLEILRNANTPVDLLRKPSHFTYGAPQANHLAFWRMARSYLSQRLTRPLPTKDGGTLRTVLDARSYMLRISKHRQRSVQWQRVAQLAKVDLGAFCRQVELSLRYDGKLDVTRME